MSNMMPGDNSGAQPMEHYARCRTNCEHVDWEIDRDKALANFYSIGCDISYWKPGDDWNPIMIKNLIRERVEMAMNLMECPEGHDDHKCNCEDIAHDEDEW